MARKEKSADAVEEVLDAEHAELRVYELGFHIDPELSSEEVKKVYGIVHDAITAAGSIVAEGEPHKVPLAYTVSRGETAGRRDFNTSFFAWIAYETDGKGHEKVAELAGAERRIFRFLDIRTDKEAARHAADLHEFLAKAAMDTAPEEDDVSDAEIDTALKSVEV